MSPILLLADLCHLVVSGGGGGWHKALVVGGRGGGGGLPAIGASPMQAYSRERVPMYPLRTAGKGTFEWGAKIARIWVHESTILAGNDYFHRVGMVAIFLKILKIKIRVPRKRNGPFLRHYGATVPHKLPSSYCGLSFCLRRHCERVHVANWRENCAKIARFLYSFLCTRAPPRRGVHQLKYPKPPQAMVACPHVLGPPLADSELL